MLLQFFGSKSRLLLVVLVSAFVVVIGQYSLVSFLFSVLQLTVPPCPAICKIGRHVPPCPMESAPLWTHPLHCALKIFLLTYLLTYLHLTKLAECWNRGTERTPRRGGLEGWIKGGRFLLILLTLAMPNSIIKIITNTKIYTLIKIPLFSTMQTNWL